MRPKCLRFCKLTIRWIWSNSSRNKYVICRKVDELCWSQIERSLFKQVMGPTTLTVINGHWGMWFLNVPINMGMLIKYFYCFTWSFSTSLGKRFVHIREKLLLLPFFRIQYPWCIIHNHFRVQRITNIFGNQFLKLPHSGYSGIKVRFLVLKVKIRSSK